MSVRDGELLGGRFRVGRPLGRGGMASVFVADDELVGCQVAVKVLHADLEGAPDMVERFEREARAAARLTSPHIVRVVELGRASDGMPWMALELLLGETLAQRLKRVGVVPPSTLIGYLRQLADGLTTAHDAGVVHRDLKPSNVFLCQLPRGRELVKIIDFGVSKLLDPAYALTTTGLAIGTPRYMAPEQLESARSVDVRADVFAVGAIAYRALAGAAPFAHLQGNDALFAAARQEPESLALRAPWVDQELDRIVTRARARNPADRYPSVAALVDELERWWEGGGAVVEARMPGGTVSDDDDPGSGSSSLSRPGSGMWRSWLAGTGSRRGEPPRRAGSSSPAASTSQPPAQRVDAPGAPQPGTPAPLVADVSEDAGRRGASTRGPTRGRLLVGVVALGLAAAAAVGAWVAVGQRAGASSGGSAPPLGASEPSVAGAGVSPVTGDERTTAASASASAGAVTAAASSGAGQQAPASPAPSSAEGASSAAPLRPTPTGAPRSAPAKPAPTAKDRWGY